MSKMLFLAAALCGLLAAGCANGSVDELLRGYDDPFDDTPAVDLLGRARTISLSWRQDEAADEYVLLRAEDDGAMRYAEVYRGPATCYTDVFTGVEGLERYLYRLDKRRGSRTFEGGRPALAWSCPSFPDPQEPNDTPDAATWLGPDRLATMPCHLFVYGGRAVYDVDWYYVDVPPHTSAYVLLEQTDVAVSSAYTDFLYMVEGGLPKPVASLTEFPVQNPGHEAARVRFCILPDYSGLFDAASGSRTLAYRLSLRVLRRDS